MSPHPSARVRYYYWQVEECDKRMSLAPEHFRHLKAYYERRVEEEKEAFDGNHQVRG